MYLGIDVGTSAVKVVVVDDSGTLLAQASEPLVISRPRPSWSEQNPDDWWAATDGAVRALPREMREAVSAIGLSGQMHGATVLGRDHRPLRPAILWNDGRSAPQCAELESAVPAMSRITGNRAMPGFTAPKLLWIRSNEPQTFKSVAKVLLPKDFVRLQMTGETASDMSDSAGTLWLDVAERCWSATMLSATGLEESQMPTLFEGTAISGELRAEVASTWGMRRIPVAAGGGDNAAGAIGVGVVRSGESFLSLGTSGVLFLANDGYRPNPTGGVHTFCHAVPARWHQMSVILSAASCLEWAARLCGLPDAAALLALAESRNQPATSELFLPYLSGERTPHNDPDARGVLFGLTHEADAAAIAQAVLEGVAFAFRDGMDALLASGATIHSMSVIGGGARSPYWGRILSAALGRALLYRDGATLGPAFGAARLAQMALTRANVEEACTPPAVLHVVEPDAQLAERFTARIGRYRDLYRRLKTHYPETAA